jgi:hypothetical protein
MSLLRNLPLITALALTPIVGCSKSKNESSVETKISSGSLLDDALLKKIPDTSAGFFILDFAGEGYTKLNSTPWASEVRGLSTIKAAIEKMESRGANDDQVRLMKAVFKSLQKLGLVSPEGRSQVEKVLSSSVAFIAVRKNESLPLDIGVFVNAAKGSNLAERLPALKGICAEANLEVVDKRIGGAEGFSATFKSTGESADERAVTRWGGPEAGDVRPGDQLGSADVRPVGRGVGGVVSERCSDRHPHRSRLHDRFFARGARCAGTVERFGAACAGVASRDDGAAGCCADRGWT